MEKAVDKILRAINDNERILIYGDYDVDGITSVALLFTILREFTLLIVELVLFLK